MAMFSITQVVPVKHAIPKTGPFFIFSFRVNSYTFSFFLGSYYKPHPLCGGCGCVQTYAQKML